MLSDLTRSLRTSDDHIMTLAATIAPRRLRVRRFDEQALKPCLVIRLAGAASNGAKDLSDELPRTFEEAIAWAKTRAGETCEMATTIANPTAGLVFDLKNATITHTVFDEDNNIIEMTYCAVTGRVLNKQVTKPTGSRQT